MTTRRRNQLVLAAVYFLCHGALFLFDLRHPAAFLTGDRAGDRISAMTSLLVGKPSVAAALAHNGAVGDYLGQLLPYALGGRIGVLLAQIALGLVAALSCHALGSRILRSESHGLAAALIMIVLTGSLLNTHTLTSEAVANPLIVIGMTLLCAPVSPRKSIGAASTPSYTTPSKNRMYGRNVL